MVNSRFKYVILSFFCIKEVKNTLLSCFLMTKWGVLVVFLRFLRTKCSFMSFEVRKLTNYRFFFDGFASGFSSLRSQRLKRSLRSRLIDRSQPKHPCVEHMGVLWFAKIPALRSNFALRAFRACALKGLNAP